MWLTRCQKFSIFALYFLHLQFFSYFSLFFTSVWHTNDKHFDIIVRDCHFLLLFDTGQVNSLRFTQWTFHYLQSRWLANTHQYQIPPFPFLNPEDWARICSNRNDIWHVSPSNFSANFETRPPPPGYTIYLISLPSPISDILRATLPEPREVICSLKLLERITCS